MAGLFDFLGQQQGGGGLLGGAFNPIADNRNAILGYLAGALQGGNLGESIGRGLTGWQGGSQADDQRRGRDAALQYVAQTGDIDPAMRRALIQNPSLATQYLQSRFKGGTSSDIAEYEYARKQGFSGTLADWMASKRAGAGGLDSTRSKQDQALRAFEERPSSTGYADVLSVITSGTELARRKAAGGGAVPESSTLANSPSQTSGRRRPSSRADAVNALKPGERIFGSGEWQTLPNGVRVREIK